MKKRKQNKLLKAIAKGKHGRVLRLSSELGYGPEVIEELILWSHFNNYIPRCLPRKHPL